MADLRNASGCVDPVQHDVIEAEEREEKRVRTAVWALKAAAEAMGFEFAERFVLRDRETGKIWR